MNTNSRLPQIDPNSAARMKSIAKRLGILVSGIGGLVLIGWVFDIAGLKSILPGLATMKSMTAMLFVLAGIALLFWVEEKSQQAVRACAFIIALIAALTLGEYIFQVDFGIDQLLFRDPATGSLFPGRMSPATALSFLLVGLSLFLGDTPMRIRFKDTMLIAVFAISMLALIGYLYSVSSLYQIGVFTSMAVHTAASFLVLATGILLARPELGLVETILAETAGGSVLRRFLPVAVGLPIFLGWIRLLGQHAGLYDTAFGLAIMVIALITTLTISIWVNAQQLTQTDWKRQQTYEALSESETRLRTTIESMAEGYQIVGYDWRHLYVNNSAVQNTQLSREQFVGCTIMECFPGIEKTAMFGSFRECMQERKARQIVTEYVFPNGTKRWFDINVQPVPDGILILSSDITERKQAELALQEREMQLSKLFEILPVGISILNAERRITYSNPALEKILHLSEKGLQQGAYAKRTYIKTDGTPMPVEDMASTMAFRENRQIDAVETGIVMEDGSTVWTSVSAVPVDIQDWKLVLVTVDITAHRQAEERFRFAIESAPNAVIMMDEHGQIVLVNSQAEKYFGYERTELMTKNIDILVPERFRGDHANHRAGYFSQPEARAMGVGRNLYGLRKDGNEFPVEIGLAPINTQEGMLVLATIVDITERKQAEDALRKSEQTFSVIFNKAPFAAGLTRLPDGVYLEVNEEFERALGFSREEIIGKSSLDLGMYPDPEVRVRSAALFHEQGFVHNIDMRLQTKTGEIRDLLVNSDLVEIGGEKHILTTANDITGRKQAELALLQERTLLRTLVDNMPNEVYVKDLDRRFLLVNELVVKALAAQSMDDVLGKSDEDFMPPEIARKFADEENEIMRTGQLLVDDEHTPSHKAGPQQWFLRTKLPLRDTTGSIIGLAGFGTNITKIKQAEEEVIKLNADLERQVKKRTAELAAANKRLQQLAILDELTGLYNRRGFLLLAEEQLLLAQRTRRNLLVFYADLDNLKQINDQYGHAAGDEAIVSAADALLKTFRISDIKARLGGDEFIVLAIEAEGHEIQILLSRLHEKLAEKNQSMSVGAVSFDAQSEISIEELIANADEAMYEVKMRKPGRHTR